MIAAALFRSGVLLAQTVVPRFLQRDFTMLSGSDIEFRVESRAPAGRAVGRWMVRIDGQWVETLDAPTPPEPHTSERHMHAQTIGGAVSVVPVVWYVVWRVDPVSAEYPEVIKFPEHSR